MMKQRKPDASFVFVGDYCIHADFRRVGVIKNVIVIDCNLISFSKVIVYNC